MPAIDAAQQEPGLRVLRLHRQQPLYLIPGIIQTPCGYKFLYLRYRRHIRQVR